MKKIGIIGGGFTGTMLASQLIEKSNTPFEIIIIAKKETFIKGIAYNPYSKKHLLNVITSKMSAYPNLPNHFLDWVMKMPDFKDKDQTLIANSFLPRYLYGEYLIDIWKNTESNAKSKNITITFCDNEVIDLNLKKNTISLTLDNKSELIINQCIIATGNNLPGNPSIKNNNFYTNKNYFQNPWSADSVKNIKSNLPVLIIGNGLTMVDTVFGLIENNFKEEIYSISPNGFNILPHRHNGLKYTKLTEELKENMRLYDLVKLVNKHIKISRSFGVSAEPIIDSLRPYSQKIWQSFTDEEKKLFMQRIRHLWGVARHRFPVHSHDKIQQLRIDGKLHIYAGKIVDINETGECVTVEYFDKKEKQNKKIKVSRVINCTGPETNLMNLDGNFLKNCLQKGIIKQDNLKLGISANTQTFQVINSIGEAHKNLFTLGSNLKGELWESTAVNELRDQAEQLAEQLKSIN
jgi:uncharacterized NAD(P)/FAD-binding protein YdhS